VLDELGQCEHETKVAFQLEAAAISHFAKLVAYSAYAHFGDPTGGIGTPETQNNTGTSRKRWRLGSRGQQNLAVTDSF